jgi:two-component system phosphate regulon response regulator OmpR
MAASPALRPHILVVDDDDRLRVLLRRFLAEQGFVVGTASNSAEAKEILENLDYDIMVLDVMMPSETGLEFLRGLRGGSNPRLRRLPVLMLTALGEANDRIGGLETGADDYLSKPFEPRELLLRINSILRRVERPQQTSAKIKLGRWHYDPQRDELQSGDETIRLTDMEAGLMRSLAAEPGGVVSREFLAEKSKSEKTSVNDRTIDVQITRLRRKIEDDAKNPRYIVTVRGEGYMLLPEVE